MAKQKEVSPSLDAAALLAGADIAAIDAAIEERRAQIKKLESEIGALKLVRRSADAYQNGAPLRRKKPKVTKPAQSEASGPAGGDQVGSAVATKITRALEKLGAATIPAIARQAELSQGITASTLEQFQRNLFKCDPGGIWKLRA